MKINILASKNELSDELREDITVQLYYGLGRYGTRIGRVHVRLDDTNGPKGGIDKRCRVEIDLLGRKDDVYAEALDSEWSEAVSRAIDKAVRQVDRKMKVFIERRGWNLDSKPFLMKGVFE